MKLITEMNEDIQLVSELMDSVEYNSDESGTTVTMTKKRDNE